jgi:predicted phosphodiesterase
MRLAIISDIHGNLLALEAVLADLRTRGVDATVNLGDCVTSPLWPRETLDLLDALSLPTVRGNHDRWIAERARDEMPPSMAFSHDALTVEQRRRLGALPSTLQLDANVLAVHGTPASDVEYLLEDAIDGRLALATAATIDRRLGGRTESLILCGHSHDQHVAHAPGNRLVVNPGSVGCPRNVDNEDPFRGEASSPHARYAIATSRSGGWTIELFALQYDWIAAAERARQNGRDDWASAFLGDQNSGGSEVRAARGIVRHGTKRSAAIGKKE